MSGVKSHVCVFVCSDGIVWDYYWISGRHTGDISIESDHYVELHKHEIGY